MDGIGTEELLSVTLYRASEDSSAAGVPISAVLDRLSGSGQRLSRQAEVAIAVETLVARGLVQRTTTEEGNRLRLTDEGRARASEVLDRLAERPIEVVNGDDRRQMTVSEAAAEFDRSPVGVIVDCSEDGVYYHQVQVERDELVGREAERTEFGSIIDRAKRTRDGEIVRLVGPGGSGKTALATAVLAATPDEVETVKTTSREAESESYQPLRDGFAQLGIENPIEATAFEADDAETFEAQQTGLFSDITDSLTPESGCRVLLFDDINQADRATWAYLSFLSERLADRPLVVILSHRPGTIPEDAPVHPEADLGETLIELAGLDRDGTSQLIEQVVGRRGAPDGFVEAVQERTGGTPLFVETTVETLLETNQIDPQLQVYPTDPGEFDLPAEVTETIQRQTATLEADVRDVLEWVAVARGYVPVSLLEEAAEDTQERVRTVLDTVTQLGLLDQETRHGERQVTFRNEVFGDALADRLADSDREQRHGTIARLLENRLGERVATDHQEAADQAATIAYHYERSGDLASAIEWYEDAADRATDVYAHETAIDYYYRVIELARQTEDTETVFTANEELAEIYLVTGDYDQAEKHIQFVRERIDEDGSGRSQRLARLRGRIYNAQGESEEAIEVATAALDGEDPVEQCRLFGVLATAHRRLGNFEQTREIAQRQRTLAETIDEPGLEADAIKRLGAVAHRQGASDQAREYWEESLAIAEEIGDRRRKAACLNNFGAVAYGESRYDQAREYFEECLAIEREIGDRRNMAMSLGSIGVIDLHCSQFERVRENCEESLTIGREIGARRGEVHPRKYLGDLAHRRGRVETAREHFEDGLAIARETGYFTGQMILLNALGDLARRRGDDDRAREYYEEVLELSEGRELPVEQAKSHRGLCALARTEGERDRAIEQFDQALTLIEDNGSPLQIGRVRLEGGNLALARDDITTARQRARTARETFEEIGASYWRGRSRQLLGTIEREDGYADAAHEHLVAAVETFEEIGSPLDALKTLEDLVDLCHSQDDEAGKRWSQRAREILADAPDEVADEYGQWPGHRVEE